MRRFVVVSVVVGSLVAAAGAHAAIPSALGSDLHAWPRTTSGNAAAGSPRSTSPTWDGVPDRRQHRLPSRSEPPADGKYPLIIVGHGYGGSKIGFGASGSTSGLRRFTSRGYAVFSMTDRGFHESCGTDWRSPPRLPAPASRASST